MTTVAIQKNSPWYTTEEITNWTKYTDKQREEIIKEIQSSRCQV